MSFESAMDALRDGIVSHYYFKTNKLFSGGEVHKEELKELIQPKTFREFVIQALMRRSFEHMMVYTQINK